MTVADDSPANPDDMFVYHNLSDEVLADPFGVDDLDHFTDILGSLGIVLPEPMILQLESDRDTGVRCQSIDFSKVAPAVA